MLNNVLERDTTRAWSAPAGGRPPAAASRPAGRSPRVLALVAAGSLALWAVAGGLAAAFAVLGAAYYVLVYTLLLKPHTALSSVPGALAGVFPALIGWAATGAPWSGSLLFLCALVFVWSPPHFWALALAREDDYRASGIPTPAVAYGERACRRLDRRLRGRCDGAHAGPGRSQGPSVPSTWRSRWPPVPRCGSSRRGCWRVATATPPGPCSRSRAPTSRHSWSPRWWATCCSAS